MQGKSIHIFLVDGNSSGFRIAEIGLSTIKAVVVPRVSLSIVKERSELQKTGIYILTGTDSESGEKKIYIGEGDTILDRLKAHNTDSNKDFWEDTVIFISKDDNLTKAHVRFLEAKLIKLAKAAKRTVVVNATAPAEQGKLPEAAAVEMDEFINQSRLLLGTLGYDFFEPLQIPHPQIASNSFSHFGSPLFLYSGANFSATCEINIDSGQFVVKIGSTSRKHEALSLQSPYKNLRNQLKNNGVLLDNSEKSLTFTQDYSFNSITTAAQVVSGSPINGRTAWKTGKPEKTFAKWQEEQLDLQENK